MATNVTDVSTGEARAALLADLDKDMPTRSHFYRHHYRVPEIDVGVWSLDVEGHGSRQLSLDELHTYPAKELRVVLECAGHRRAEFDPTPAGITWGAGAVSEAVWKGTPLASVFTDVDVADAAFVILEGADRGSVPFARALPLSRALHPDTLLAWEMNGEPLPRIHGAPLRVVVPGWYATDSVKWLRRITVTREPFTGRHELNEYRFRTGRDRNGRRLTTLAVHALLTSYGDGDHVQAGGQTLHGVAWGGNGEVAAVRVSLDTIGWRSARLSRPSSPYAFTKWELPWTLPQGWSTISVMATDAEGRSQPQHAEWNEGGYANSCWHRVRVHAS